MNKKTERRLLDGFLVARGITAQSVRSHERPDFLIDVDGEQIGVEVTQLIEASPRQLIAPQQWDAEANKACRAARQMYEAVHSGPVIVHLQFKPECSLTTFRAPALPAELAAAVRDHLQAQSAPWPLRADALVNNPHPALAVLYAAPLTTGESDWRLGGASSARPATCDDICATVGAKEPLVQDYRQAAAVAWLLVDCDLLGQGVSLLIPDGQCQVETTFDAVFCIDFYGSCRKIQA